MRARQVHRVEYRMERSDSAFNIVILSDAPAGSASLSQISVVKRRLRYTLNNNISASMLRRNVREDTNRNGNSNSVTSFDAILDKRSHAILGLS